MGFEMTFQRNQNVKFEDIFDKFWYFLQTLDQRDN